MLPGSAAAQTELHPMHHSSEHAPQGQHCMLHTAAKREKHMAGEPCMLQLWDRTALQAQRRVLRAVAKDIQQRHEALQLPQELALPQLTGRRSQDRDYAEMGTQLLAMLAAIDQSRADAVKVSTRPCRVVVTSDKGPLAAG